MPDYTSCVVDTSVIIKALFSPSQRYTNTSFPQEIRTHKVCIALLSALDEKGIGMVLPHCSIVEIAAVASRLSNKDTSEAICKEIESSVVLIPESKIIGHAKTIAIDEGCPGFDTYFIAIAELESIPLFTDDRSMHNVCGRRDLRSWLVRDLDMDYPLI